MWESGLDNIEMRDLDQCIKNGEAYKDMKAAGLFKILFVLRGNKVSIVSFLIKSMGFEVGLTGSGYLYLLESSTDLIIG